MKDTAYGVRIIGIPENPRPANARSARTFMRQWLVETVALHGHAITSRQRKGRHSTAWFAYSDRALALRGEARMIIAALRLLDDTHDASLRRKLAAR